MVEKWTADNIPDMTGKVIVITGANSGLGYESSLALARKNATVIMACRSTDRGQSALNEVKRQIPNADVTVMALNLGDLASVREFADAFKAKYDRLDVLLNNAGVMALPFGETADGFENQFGINHLGHFALTGLLLDTLLKTDNSRIVNVSSNLHRQGKMHFDDLHMRNNYSRWQAYNQSKLANLLFTQVLDKRLDANNTIVVAAHPGFSNTNLQAKTGNPILTFFMEKIISPIMAQSAEMGALPQLYASVMPDVKGGEYYGPHKQMRGYPALEVPSEDARNDADAERLWDLSVEMTGVDYSILKTGA